MYDHKLFSLRAPICSFCTQPVLLDKAKTDEDGKAIHEACYLVKIGVTKPAMTKPGRGAFAHVLEMPHPKRNWRD